MEQTTLSKYVKAMRKQYNLTQVELSEKSGVGLRLVRELEQGKQTLRLDKVNQRLNLFDSEVGVVSITKSDMLSTALVMPEDTEELALTLNGKKRKIKKTDFVTSMQASGLEDKVIEKIFNKFAKAKEKWFELIDLSFLPDDMKEAFKALITQRLSLLA